MSILKQYSHMCIENIFDHCNHPCWVNKHSCLASCEMTATVFHLQVSPMPTTSVVRTARSTNEPVVSITMITTPLGLNTRDFESVRTEEASWMRGETSSSIFSRVFVSPENKRPKSCSRFKFDDSNVDRSADSAQESIFVITNNT